MPYIKQELRDIVDPLIYPLEDTILNADLPVNIGLVNYIITRIVSAEIRNNMCYQTINEAIGVLECCKQELYRRLAVPYEIKKCKENGDVFDV